MKGSGILPVEEVSVGDDAAALFAADEDGGEDVADLEDTAGGLVHEHKVPGGQRLTMCTAQCTLHIAHCTLHIYVHCTLSILHNKLCTVQYALYTAPEGQAVVLVLPVSEGVSVVARWYDRTADNLAELLS